MNRGGFCQIPRHIDRQTFGAATHKQSAKWPRGEKQALATLTLMYNKGVREGELTMNVMVIEDIPDVALTFAALIRAYGHRTQVAYDGTTALQMVREFKPHTIFIDIHLPDMYGYDLAVQLRNVPGLEDAMLVSVSGNEIDEQRWKASNIDRHLQKPLTVDSLMGILEPQPQRSTRG